MMRNKGRMRRLGEEVLLLAMHLGPVEYDHHAGRWVMLPSFPLPSQLGPPDCALLMLIPESYPAVPPHGVYIDRGLPVHEHYYSEESAHNRYANQGWGWLCLHAPEQTATWRPGVSVLAGDNLLVLLRLVQAMLDELS